MVTILEHRGKRILWVDYSDHKEDGMIALVQVAHQMLVENPDIVLVGSQFNHRNFATPRFLRFTESTLKEMEHRLQKNAITGISDVQQWILKGINVWYKRKIHYFPERQQVLDFLAAED